MTMDLSTQLLILSQTFPYLEAEEERYDALLARSPGFFQKAFLKHIANYLGMTPGSLSTIMKRKKEQ